MTKAKSENQDIFKENSRRALGRGLSSLMSSTANKQSTKTKSASSTSKPIIKTNVSSIEGSGQVGSHSGISELPITDLLKGSGQPRDKFESEELEELADSIKESGIIQPIIVTPSVSEKGKYEIVAGERRFKAAKLVQLSSVPVIIRNYDEIEKLKLGLVENIQRKDLNVIEKAKGYKRLMEEFGRSQQEVAKMVGVNRSSVANIVRLLNLSIDIQEMVADGQITEGHARAILSVSNDTMRSVLAKKIVREGLSVREAEESAKNINNPPTKIGHKVSKKRDFHQLEEGLIERLRRALGTKISVKMTNKDKGEIKISFFSTEELEKILEIVEK